MRATTIADKTAANKAMEYMYPKEIRLFDDPYIFNFISPFNKLCIKMLKYDVMLKRMNKLMEKLAPGIYGGLVCRTRYIDDAIKKCLDDGFEAIVNLGGGYDSRCLRIEGINNIEYYHIDQPEVIDSYKQKLLKFPNGIPKCIRFVPIDFNSQSIEEELSKHGYDKRIRTLFIWEGVTQYITREAVNGTLSYISSTSKDNRVVFTYIIEELLKNPGAYPKYEKVLERVKKTGANWINGFDQDEVSSYINNYGLELIEDIGQTDFHKRYLDSLNRNLEVMPIERTVLAKVI